MRLINKNKKENKKTGLWFYRISGFFLFFLFFLSLANFASAVSARKLPTTAYVVHTYGTGKTYQVLQEWENLTTVNLASVTTTNGASSGNTLNVSSTVLFDTCVLNESRIYIAATGSSPAQTLTITGVNTGSLTVSDISGTIPTSTAVQTGFVLTAYTGNYNDSVILAGATNTSNSFFRVIRAANGQRGTPTDGVRIFSANSGEGAFIFNVNEANAGIYDIASYYSTNTTSWRGIFYANSVAGVKIIGCTAWANAGTNQVRGFSTYRASNAVFINNYAFNLGSGDWAAGLLLVEDATARTVYAYNNTFRNSNRGFYTYVYGGGSLTVNSKNCIFQNNTTNIGNYGPLTHNQTTNTITGVTFDTDGYHLKQGVIGSAVAQGTDLSGVSPSTETVFPFDDDIDGNTITRAWGIGADWYAPTQAPASSSSRKLPTYYYESTYNSAGGANYTALTVWEQDTDITLTTPTVGFVLTCAAGIHADTVVMAGAVTNASYFRVIRAASGQRGTPTSGVRFYSTATAAASGVITGTENFTGIYDVATYFSTSSTNHRQGISVANCTGVKIIGCTAWGHGGTDHMRGIQAYDCDITYIIDSYVYNSGTNTYSCGIQVGSSSGTRVAYVYNSTSLNNKQGVGTLVFGGTTTVYATNVIAQGNTTAFAGNIITTNPATSGVIFEADGYHLSTSDIGAKDLWNNNSICNKCNSTRKHNCFCWEYYNNKPCHIRRNF